MIRTDGVVNEESRDLCMHGLHGLQICVAWASGEQRVAFASEREVTRQGTGQRCSNDSFHEESITQAWRDEHLRGGGTMEHRETAFEGEDG